jgi:ribonuclease J
MEPVRIFALGGMDEDGKNMLVVEVGQDIYIIEAGIKFPDAKESLGIEFIIQDFTYLIENKERIKAIFITHGHDDVMGALPFLLKQIKCDVYTCPLASKVIAKKLKSERITGVKIYQVRRHDSRVIGGHHVEFFPTTHAYPGSFGLGILSEQGYIVYSGEFIEDYSELSESYRADISSVAKIRDKGVLVLMQESKGADRPGHTSPNHRLYPKLEKVLDQSYDKRVFICVYTQSVYWIEEILKCCQEHNRKLVLYSKELRELIKSLEEVGLEVPGDIIVDESKINTIDNVVVLISGQGKALFQTMSNISNNEVNGINFTMDDVVVIATPIVPGVEKEFKAMENDIYKRDGRIVVINKDVLSMHPSKEDLKMMMFMTRPKYYIPFKGEYRMLCANAAIAQEMGLTASHIILLDNGQVATFENGRLVSCSMELELHDTMIDGKENWDMAGVVLKDREILSTDGVMILAIGLDAKTKKIINGPDIQSRGLIYLKDAEYITSDVSKIMEDTINEAVANHNYENLSTRSEIRDKVAKYLMKQTAKRPMILPVILEINPDYGKKG